MQLVGFYKTLVTG